MTRFWFVSAPLISHTDWGGFLQTAQSLQRDGHDVLWISSSALRDYIQNVGLQFQEVEHTGWLWPPPPQPDLTSIPPQEAVTLRYVRALNTWLSEDLVSEGTQALIELAGKIGKPDIIATDPFLSATALAAEALDVPLVICGWPAQQPLDDTRLFPVQQHLGSESRQRISRLCDRFGLSGENFAPGPTPSIMSPYLHINYFTPEWYITEQDTLLDQNLFVGGSKSQPQNEPPDWLRQIQDDVPLAVITLGSIFTGDLGFFSWAAQAAAQVGLLPVIAIGWNPLEADKKADLIAALPKGTRLLNWIPFEHVLPRAHLIIHHGGMGTTHRAVVHALPQIVVPHAADQRIQAKRVTQAKVGLHLTAHDVRQGMLREGSKALLHDDKVKQTAKQLASHMAALGGVDRAASALAALARSK